MNKNQKIAKLAKEIMDDVIKGKSSLQSIVLKASSLYLLLDDDNSSRIVKGWAKNSEDKQFIIDSYESELNAAKDPNISLTSANPYQVIPNFSNANERKTIKEESRTAISCLAACRTEIYDFASRTYNSWIFGNVAETIFEKKRKRIEPAKKS